MAKKGEKSGPATPGQRRWHAPLTRSTRRDDPFAITAPPDPRYRHGWLDDAGYAETAAQERRWRLSHLGIQD